MGLDSAPRKRYLPLVVGNPVRTLGEEDCPVLRLRLTEDRYQDRRVPAIRTA